ncbi:Per1-like protein [Artomyces pyxidatus]|uniref:Per1-like protein n=1 Tax=Artomyces pyxidatus TaxID=48021 RepID=A0ACB8T1H0_9AGAM|nr:Per1-like protein [Artomyces pyxidatus]
MRLLSPLFALVLLSSCTSASSGDRANDYQVCLGRCEKTNCAPGTTPSFPLFMRLTLWTCVDDCKYKCMHMVTDFSMESGVPIQQYYGKWPFYRFAGMQEPASVLFSFTNLLLHVWGRNEVQRSIADDHPMKPYYMVWSYISCNAWIWSAVFHTRDTPLTEKLDYFSAALAILYSLYFSVVRLFHLYPVRSRTFSHPSGGRRLYRVWTALTVLVYLAHVAYLGLSPRFDYTYNIIFNLALGLTHNFLWLAFALPSSRSLFRRYLGMPKSYRPAHANDAAIAVVLTTAATCLELFDFAPWRGIIDAHSLWHLATAPLAVVWYDFLVTDALDGGWKGTKT